MIRHYTSRAGDPHRHLHLQINARVWAAGAWRGIHSVGIRDSIEAINGIGHAAVATDPQFRAVLAEHGYTIDPETSEIRQLKPYVGAFSARAAQIRRNTDRYEAAWRRRASGRGARTTVARRLGSASLGAGAPRQGRPPRRRRAGRAVEQRAARPRLPRPCRASAPGGDPAGVGRPRRSRRPGRLDPGVAEVGVERRGHPRQDRGAARPDRRWSRTGPRGSSSPRTSPPVPPAGAPDCSRGPRCPSTCVPSPPRASWTSRPT